MTAPTIAAAGLALLVTGGATPLVIRLAHRAGWVDRPGGWKRHGAVTPNAGGIAVTAGLIVGVSAFSGDLLRVLPIVGGALVLWLVGALDDRNALRPAPRLLAEAGAGVGLWLGDLGWQLHVPELLNGLLTVLWVIAVVNALNLLDLMDGVATSAAVAAAGAAAFLAALDGDAAIAAVGFAAVGAGLAFLPYNLARPSRIFLGDGGSMALGFVCAATIMASASGASGGWAALGAGVILFGVPLLDMVFRVLLRLHRGISVLEAGHDSLASRLLTVMTSARVALAVGLAQVLAGAAAVTCLVVDESALGVVFAVLVLVGMSAATAIQMALGERHDRLGDRAPTAVRGRASAGG
jgi:UDP-GlcNAc:undecaprenyl-phosphate GlcNAc-1-phosphate transferase